MSKQRSNAQEYQIIPGRTITLLIIKTTLIKVVSEQDEHVSNWLPMRTTIHVYFLDNIKNIHNYLHFYSFFFIFLRFISFTFYPSKSIQKLVIFNRFSQISFLNFNQVLYRLEYFLLIFFVNIFL